MWPWLTWPTHVDLPIRYIHACRWPAYLNYNGQELPAFKYATKSSKQENAYKLPRKQEDLHMHVQMHVDNLYLGLWSLQTFPFNSAQSFGAFVFVRYENFCNWWEQQWTSCRLPASHLSWIPCRCAFLICVQFSHNLFYKYIFDILCKLLIGNKFFLVIVTNC